MRAVGGGEAGMLRSACGAWEGSVAVHADEGLLARTENSGRGATGESVQEWQQRRSAGPSQLGVWAVWGPPPACAAMPEAAILAPLTPSGIPPANLQAIT